MTRARSAALARAGAAHRRRRAGARCYTAAALAPTPLSLRSTTTPAAADEVDRDGELLRRLRERDPEALGELYDRHGSRVHAVAARIDRASAEDVAHEVFLKLWRDGGGFAGRARFATWLYRMTVNAALDQARRRKVRDAVSLDALAAVPAAAGALLDAERIDLAAALAELPERLRVPVVLRFFAGLEYREIAAELGCREGTVASRLSRALARLGARLGAPPREGAR
jgi:RNA polymerase sigma-70 factor (ECF subfamily)